MKKFNTISKAVNRELIDISPIVKSKKHVSIENKVFIILGALLIASILVNIVVNGIPNI